ncbi:MAG: hypothetical protein JW751_10925 [Polyangiaceae bacterium]|nr:hypothetical protein [Polyangiaceae bacterium]
MLAALAFGTSVASTLWNQSGLRREKEARQASEKETKDTLLKLQALAEKSERRQEEFVTRLATLTNRDEVREAFKGTELAKRVEEAQNAAGCADPGSFRRGEAQLRVFTGKTETEATQKRSALASLLNDKGLGEWSKWIDVFSSNLGSDKVWVVVFNKVEPTVRDPMCAWLQCNGWKDGLLKCDMR